MRGSDSRPALRFSSEGKLQGLYALQTPDGDVLAESIRHEIDPCWCAGLDCPEMRGDWRPSGGTTSLHDVTAAAVGAGWKLLELEIHWARDLGGPVEVTFMGRVLRDASGWRPRRVEGDQA